MFKKVSLSVKLVVPTLVLAILFAGIGWWSLKSLDRVSAQFFEIADNYLPSVSLSKEIFLEYRQVRISLRTLGLNGISKTDADKAVEDVKKNIADLETNLKDYEKLLTNAEEKELYTKVNQAWQNFKAIGVNVLEYQAQNTEESKAKMQQIFLVDCPREASHFREAMTKLVQFNESGAKEASKTAHELSTHAKDIILYVLIGGLLVGLGMMVLSVRSAANLIKSITAIAASLQQRSEVVSDIASNVAGTSEKISSSTSQQAAAIQETTAAVEETRAIVGKNAENAERSSQLATKSQETANKGKDAVQSVLNSMNEMSESNNEIANYVEESNQELQSILKIIQDIDSKTKVINDIVFQTKLLSFNASVEAARAGEHGKGFAVVAEEIGSLATMSGKSAQEITALLEESTRNVQSIVVSTKQKLEGIMSSGRERAERGTETATLCDQVLSEIVEDVSHVGQLVSEISVASQEQSKGISEINKAIAELDVSAQQNSSASSEAASSADRLSVEVQNLKDTILQLSSIVNVKTTHQQDDSAQVIHLKREVA